MHLIPNSSKISYQFSAAPVHLQILPEKIKLWNPHVETGQLTKSPKPGGKCDNTSLSWISQEKQFSVQEEGYYSAGLGPKQANSKAISYIFQTTLIEEQQLFPS